MTLERTTALYFAYGSNMVTARMQGRVPSARPVGCACLEGHALRMDKRGRDGSGKANLRVDPSGRVFGALYAIDSDDWLRLDACEPGYERVAIDVMETARGLVTAQTYVSGLLAAEPIAFDWYKELLLTGAREHGLPGAYVDSLAALPSRRDPASDGGD